MFAYSHLDVKRIGSIPVVALELPSWITAFYLCWGDPGSILVLVKIPCKFNTFHVTTFVDVMVLNFMVGVFNRS